MRIEDRALMMATEAHSGQTDKVGNPYILHVIRVWLACQRQGHGSAVECAAILHDAVEDTDVTLSEIEMTFGIEVRDAVDALTKREGESLDGYLARVAANPIARIVKVADSTDNYNRLVYIEDDDIQHRLSRKYLRVLEYLREHPKPDPSGDDLE